MIDCSPRTRRGTRAYRTTSKLISKKKECCKANCSRNRVLTIIWYGTVPYQSELPVLMRLRFVTHWRDFRWVVSVRGTWHETCFFLNSRQGDLGYRRFALCY